jgi:head-tail adaptor
MPVKPAAYFIDHLEWLKRTQAAAGDGFGQKADAFTSQGFLWCATADLAGGRRTAKESERQERTATVRIRGRVGVVAGDRLRNAALGDLWTVDSVVFNWTDYETVCDVTAPKWTTGGGTA